MSGKEEKQPEGFSSSEKVMLVKAVITGAAALLVTLWFGNVFDADDPAPLSLSVIFSCLFSFLVAAATSIMSESAIGDIVKLLMFTAFWFLWYLYGEHAGVELVMLGMVIGSAVGLLSNRLPNSADRK